MTDTLHEDGLARAQEPEVASPAPRKRTRRTASADTVESASTPESEAQPRPRRTRAKAASAAPAVQGMATPLDDRTPTVVDHPAAGAVPDATPAIGVATTTEEAAAKPRTRRMRAKAAETTQVDSAAAERVMPAPVELAGPVGDPPALVQETLPAVDPAPTMQAPDARLTAPVPDVPAPRPRRGRPGAPPTVPSIVENEERATASPTTAGAPDTAPTPSSVPEYRVERSVRPDAGRPAASGMVERDTAGRGAGPQPPRRPMGRPDQRMRGDQRSPERPVRPNAGGFQRPPSQPAAPRAPRLAREQLEAQSIGELRALALDFGLAVPAAISRTDLLTLLLQAQAEAHGLQLRSGILEIVDAGHGYLRCDGAGPHPDDVYVAVAQIRRFGLRTGDLVSGEVRPPRRDYQHNEKYAALTQVLLVNGGDPAVAAQRPTFDKLTPLYPDERLALETEARLLSTRLIDMVAPIGKGQRGLIVAPPKAGKTMLLKAIAAAIRQNYPAVRLMLVLVGERPEEVTDLERSVAGAEVISATFDEPVERHTHVAEIALERAKRLVETGEDVVILLDSITRLTRAYNLDVPPSGRTLSGGIDPAALYPPKRFIGAARNIEGGGSLTILATCLVDTGSRMDELIYEEFKGTGNMEIHLERGLAEKRIFPAINIQRSGTRHEEYLLDEATLNRVYLLRRLLGAVENPTQAAETVLTRLAAAPTNQEFLAGLTRGG